MSSIIIDQPPGSISRPHHVFVRPVSLSRPRKTEQTGHYSKKDEIEQKHLPSVLSRAYSSDVPADMYNVISPFMFYLKRMELNWVQPFTQDISL